MGCSSKGTGAGGAMEDWVRKEQGQYAFQRASCVLCWAQAREGESFEDLGAQSAEKGPDWRAGRNGIV